MLCHGALVRTSRVALFLSTAPVVTNTWFSLEGLARMLHCVLMRSMVAVRTFEIHVGSKVTASELPAYLHRTLAIDDIGYRQLYASN